MQPEQTGAAAGLPETARGFGFGIFMTNADTDAFPQGRVDGADDVDVDKLKVWTFGFAQEILQRRNIGETGVDTTGGNVDLHFVQGAVRSSSAVGAIFSMKCAWVVPV